MVEWDIPLLKEYVRKPLTNKKKMLKQLLKNNCCLFLCLKKIISNGT